jgi:ATP-dependent helicase/nuclease subunit A
MPDYQAWRSARDTLLAKQDVVHAVAATAIAKADDKPELPDAGDDRAFRRGRAATSVGRAVHAVLQSVDLATGDDAGPLSIAAAAAEGVPARRAEIESLVRAAIASDVVRAAVAGGRYWREVFVAAPVGETLVEGYIDLLYEGPHGLVVVDYKTDSVDGEDDLSAAVARYRLQGAAYAVALERTLSRPVAECLFLFARARGAPSLPVHDLREAMADVERAVAAHAQ